MHKSKHSSKISHVRGLFRGKVIIPITFLIVSIIFISLPINEIHAITLKELGNEIAKLSGNEENLIEEIIAAETLVGLKTNEITSLNSDLDSYNKQLEELYAKRSEIKNEIEDIRGLLVDRMIFSYKYGNNDLAKMIITAKDINEVANNLYIYKNIMEQDAELIKDFRLKREEYDRIYKKSEEKKKEIEVLKAQIEEEKEVLENAIAKKEGLLEEIKMEKGDLEVLLSEIKARIAAIQPAGITLIGEWDMVATAYYAFGSGGNDINGNGITAIGYRARKGIVAVDPGVIPLGTKLYIDGYGEALAADTGGWIKGNRIDLVFETLEECYRFGRRKIKVYLVED